MLAYEDNMARNKGFTLIELLVTIAILGIIAAMGIPSFTQTIRNSQLTTDLTHYRFLFRIRHNNIFSSIGVLFS